MPITMNHSAPFGAYGGAMANAARQTAYAEGVNPFIQQYFGQQFQSGEANLQRGWQTGESALDRAMQKALQEGQLAFQGREAELERALREKLQSQQLATAYPNAGKTSYNFVGPYGGPGSYGYGAQRIHEAHFGY